MAALTKIEHRGLTIDFQIYLKNQNFKPNSDSVKVFCMRKSLCGEILREIHYLL